MSMKYHNICADSPTQQATWLTNKPLIREGQNARNRCKPLLKFCISLLMLASLSNAQAGAGHDHGHDHDATPTTALPNAPQRLPDGQVFLPKASQRLMQIQTMPVQSQNVPHTLVLNGTVIRQSTAESTLLAPQNGQLTLLDKVPALGSDLQKGQRWATLTLSADAQEQTNQQATLADLQQQLKLAKLEHRRVAQLGELIPRKTIDAAANTIARLQAQIAVYQQGKVSQLTLRIPQSGIVKRVSVSHKQTVQAGDHLLTLLDPSQVMVEAISYDPLLTKNIHRATLLAGDQQLSLTYQGTLGELRQQTLPLRFTALGKQAQHALSALPIGLPIQVLIEQQEKHKGVPIHRTALAKNASNQSIVWVKVAPEHYRPQVVIYQPLDGKRVLVTQGLQDDERVVTTAVTLLNQIR